MYWIIYIDCRVFVHFTMTNYLILFFITFDHNFTYSPEEK